MTTDSVYDKWFCMKCKFSNVVEQGPFFRVNVVNDCATDVTCSSAPGEFYDFTDSNNKNFRI
jgi:hypothetical protein